MSDKSDTPSVLIADDDPVQRRLLSDFFKRRNWAYEAVEDGQKALDAAGRETFDLIVTDLVMPGLSGLALLKEIRDQYPAQAIIVMTGSSPVQDAAVLFREGGAIDFLEKPVDLEILAESVERVVDDARQVAFETALAKHLRNESSTFQLSSRELAACRFPLPILNRLEAAGCVDRNTRLRLELAFQEALANSLEHGNLELNSEWREEFDDTGKDRYSLMKEERLADAQYADRKITVSWTYRDGQLELIFQDQGPGFDFRKSGNPTVDDSGEAAVAVHGRGISIMRGVMDEVVYSDGGRRMTLRKRLDSPAGK